MKQQWIKSPLALRRSIGAFAGLPEEAAPAVRPQRLLGVGTSNLLLALLPAPLARLLTLAGFGRPSEARGLEMLREAAEGGGGGDGVYDGGARWLARVALLLFGNTAATMRGGGDAAAEKARALASLAALEAELPGSLLFEWVGALTLRRVGELPAAARRPRGRARTVGGAAAGVPALPRPLQRRAAPLRHAAVRRRRRRPRPARRRGVAVHGEGMCLWHRAAALSQLGRCDEARDDLRAIAVTAKATGGRLDAQLAQRAAGWLLRADADLALGALEVSYQMGYHRQRRAQPGGGGENGGGEGGGETGGGGDASATLAELEAHAAPSLAAAAASASAEVRAAALLLGGALAAAAGRHAEAREGLGRAREAAATAEYLETAPDRWVAAFASLELANVCVDTADFEGASAALRAASQVADKSFSFHSWLGSAVREARARLKRARESAGAAPAPPRPTRWKRRRRTRRPRWRRCARRWRRRRRRRRRRVRAINFHSSSCHKGRGLAGRRVIFALPVDPALRQAACVALDAGRGKVRTIQTAHLARPPARASSAEKDAHSTLPRTRPVERGRHSAFPVRVPRLPMRYRHSL